MKQTKKKGRNEKTAEEIKTEQDRKKEEKDTELCAAEIEVILKKYDRALQPFLMNTEFGNYPRVRLSLLPDEKATK